MKKRPGFPARLDLGSEAPPPTTTMAVTKLLSPKKVVAPQAVAKVAPVPVPVPKANRNKQVSAPAQLGLLGLAQFLPLFLLNQSSDTRMKNAERFA